MKKIIIDGNKQTTPMDVYRFFLMNLILDHILEITLMHYMTLWFLLIRRIGL